MQQPEDALVPYQAVRTLGPGNVVVFAPHPDDEVLGCGGAIMRHLAAGDSVTVVVVTSGGYPTAGQTDSNAYAQVRRQESLDAAQILGCKEPVFWDYPDRRLQYGEELIARIRNTLESLDANLVYAPSYFEVHPDHRALAWSTAEAVRRRQHGCRLAMYEVGNPLPPNLLLDISDLQGRKLDAVRCFTSQLAVQRYDRHIAALNAFRTYTLGSDISAAEAYLVTDNISLQKNLRTGLQQFPMPLRHPEADYTAVAGPLVSVIIRCMGIPELGEALESVAAQTYGHIEVLVVDAAGKNGLDLPEWCGRFPLRVITERRPLPRSAAANAGLDAAKGDFLAFLDEDDWLYPDHVSVLLEALRADRDALAAYSGVLHTSTRDDNEGTPLNDPFDPVRLRCQNYIPIHAVVFARALLDQGCRIDESLEVYEDWDLWLQMSRLTGFLHIDRITAGYRAGGESGAGWGSDPASVQRRQERLMAKWQRIWTPLELREALQWQDRRAEHHNWEQWQETKAHNALLEEKLAACRSERETILRSKSWRMGKPLRLAARLWRSLFRRG